MNDDRRSFLMEALSQFESSLEFAALPKEVVVKIRNYIISILAEEIITGDCSHCEKVCCLLFGRDFLNE